MVLVGQHVGNEPAHEAKRHGAVATAGDIAQIQDQAARGTELREGGVKGGYGGLFAEGIVEADETKVRGNQPGGERAGFAIEPAFQRQGYGAALVSGVHDGESAGLVGAAGEEGEQRPGAGMGIALIHGGRQAVGDGLIKRLRADLEEAVARSQAGAGGIAARADGDNDGVGALKFRPHIGKGGHRQPAMRIAGANFSVKIVKFSEGGFNHGRVVRGRSRPVHGGGKAGVPGFPGFFRAIEISIVVLELGDEIGEIRAAGGGGKILDGEARRAQDSGNGQEKRRELLDLPTAENHAGDC